MLQMVFIEGLPGGQKMTFIGNRRNPSRPIATSFEAWIAITDLNPTHDVRGSQFPTHVASGFDDFTVVRRS